MLSPCLFIVLLAIGYFFIDKKTQTELINKCKKNKFMILGGIVFIYYFFLRNAVEGFNQSTGEEFVLSVNKTGEQMPNKVVTAFVEELCYGRRGADSYRESLKNARLSNNTNATVQWTEEEINSISDLAENVVCLEQLLQEDTFRKLKTILTYDIIDNGSIGIVHTANFKSQRNNRNVTASINITNRLDDIFKYNIESSLFPNRNIEKPETETERQQRAIGLGIQCNKDINAGMTKDNSDACKELANFQ